MRSEYAARALSAQGLERAQPLAFQPELEVAALEAANLIVGEMVDHLGEFRVLAEEMPARVATGFDGVFLVISVQRLFHALHEQALAEHVVRLVRAGVIQVFALDVDLSAAEVFGQPLD